VWLIFLLNGKYYFKGTIFYLEAFPGSIDGNGDGSDLSDGVFQVFLVTLLDVGEADVGSSAVGAVVPKILLKLNHKYLPIR